MLVNTSEQEPGVIKQTKLPNTVLVGNNTDNTTNKQQQEDIKVIVLVTQ